MNLQPRPLTNSPAFKKFQNCKLIFKFSSSPLFPSNLRVALLSPPSPPIHHHHHSIVAVQTPTTIIFLFHRRSRITVAFTICDETATPNCRAPLSSPPLRHPTSSPPLTVSSPTVHATTAACSTSFSFLLFPFSQFYLTFSLFLSLYENRRKRTTSLTLQLLSSSTSSLAIYLTSGDHMSDHHRTTTCRLFLFTLPLALI
ncbi:uncharacterized protein DS421_9g286950 [Arachis hypogaea]|nr:uncharacterized protein DS421_9g286950 [Arachis hypogaea]